MARLNDFIRQMQFAHILTSVAFCSIEFLPTKPKVIFKSFRPSVNKLYAQSQNLHESGHEIAYFRPFFGEKATFCQSS